MIRHTGDLFNMEHLALILFVTAVIIYAIDTLRKCYIQKQWIGVAIEAVIVIVPIVAISTYRPWRCFDIKLIWRFTKSSSYAILPEPFALYLQLCHQSIMNNYTCLQLKKKHLDLLNPYLHLIHRFVLLFYPNYQ